MNEKRNKGIVIGHTNSQQWHDIAIDMGNIQLFNIGDNT